MALFISERIRQREFGREISAADKKALLAGARVCLSASIAGHGLPKGTRLLKAYATTKLGLRRILYILVVQEKDFFVLFHRPKRDDAGANMSPKNPAFNSALTKHLDLHRDDLADGRIEEITPEAGSVPV